MNPSTSPIHETDRLWHTLRLTDRRRLQGQRCRILEQLKTAPDKLDETELSNFRDRVAKAAERSLVPYAQKLHCEPVPELPVTAKIPEIRAAMKENQVVIVCGATGSGKTTQLPKAALMQGYGRAGRIGCTQPRRIAASALAARLSEEMQCTCGQEIGYQVRFDDHTSENTVIKFMTDGILLAETRNDPLLLQYDCLILDEVHERSLNIDFLLGYVKLLLAKRKDIRILISSATLETARLSDFFGGAPVIEAEGRTYPVEDCYLPSDEEDEEELPEQVTKGVQFLTELDSQGDILVFLPGEREIRDCAEHLAGHKFARTEILPLFGRLSASEQARIFQHSRFRRIILATNVAETSLTIPGIRFVIDSGLVRLSRFNPKSRIQELQVEMISKASAMQRRGRCGRVRDGVCVRLYSEEQFNELEDFTVPEIQRSSLAGVILQMALLKLPKIDVFPFVAPPSPAHIREGMIALNDLGALDRSGNLTETGRKLAQLPVDPHLGAILLAGERYRVRPQIAVITSFLSIADPRERPFEKAKEADLAHKKYQSETSDFIGILKLWEALRDDAGNSNSSLRKYTKTNYLNFRRCREWKNLAQDLWEYGNDEGKEEKLPDFLTEKTPFDPVHKALLCGLPRHLAMYQPENNEYSDMNGKKFVIFPGSALAKRKTVPKWLLFFALVETARVFGRTVAEIKPEWMEECAPQLCHKLYDRIEWDETSGFVYAREKVAAGQLLVNPGRRCHYGRIDPVKSREIFIREGLVPGRIIISGTWASEYVQLVRSLRALEIRQRRPDSLINESALQEHFEKVIPSDMCSVRDLKQHWSRTKQDFTPEDEVFLLCDKNELHVDDFPDVIDSAGIKVNVEYLYAPGEEGDGITYVIQENCLNLVSRYLADYPVAGYLPWKLDFAFRSLPKTYRKEIMPISDAVGKFMSLYRSGRIFMEQPFHRALIDFLSDEYHLDVPEEITEAVEYPEYLKIRIALKNEDGRIVKVIHQVPRFEKEKTTVAKTIPIAEHYTLSGLTDWPDDLMLPRSLRISPRHEKLAVPALKDEGETAGCALFLDADEAAHSHRKGLVRLIRLQYPAMIRQLRGSAKATPRMKLSILGDYPDWINDLLNYSILSALDDAPEDIRSASVFGRNKEAVRNETAGLFQKNIEFLASIAEYVSCIEETLEDFHADGRIAMDVHTQLDFLFRDGFLRTPEAVKEYGRYLKALSIRLERAKTSPAKDGSKGEFLEEYLRKFHAALQGEKTPEESPALLDYFLTMEEARISAWSPEMPVKRKISPSKLKESWDFLKANL